MSKSKQDLIDLVADDVGLNKTAAKAAVESVLAGISALAEDKLVIVGYGTFQVKDVAAREARNPVTGEKVQVPAKTKLTFKQAKVKK